MTKAGVKHLAAFGININADQNKSKSKRPICRPCLDWSERRPHVAGVVGAVICQYFLTINW